MCTFVAMLAAVYCCTCVYFRSLFLCVRLLPCWRHCTAVRVYIFGVLFISVPFGDFRIRYLVYIGGGVGIVILLPYPAPLWLSATAHSTYSQLLLVHAQPQGAPCRGDSQTLWKIIRTVAFCQDSGSRKGTPKSSVGLEADSVSSNYRHISSCILSNIVFSPYVPFFYYPTFEEKYVQQ
jgi:hypothetical protein